MTARLDSLLKQVNAAAREVVAAIQDIDSRIAALNEKRQGIGEAPVNRAEFLSYIGTSIDQKIGGFCAEKEREMGNMPTAFFALEGAAPTMRFLSPSFAPVTISEEACYFYLKPMILARMAEIAEGLDFPEDSIPVDKRREMIAEIDLEITKLRTERAELASQLQKAGVVR